MRLRIDQFDSPVQRPSWAPLAVGSARATAVVAGAFCAAVLVGMILTYARERADHPLSEVQIPALEAQLTQNPADEQLKQQIRDRDVVVRARYFGRREFMKRGSYLLLGGAIVLIASLKLAMSLTPAVPQIQGQGVPDPWQAAPLIRRSVAAAGLAVTGVFIALMLMPRPQIPQLASVAPQDPQAASPAVLPPPTDEALQANWPGFRGPFGLGIASAQEMPPLEWDAETGKNVLWQAEIPLTGHNTPIVWGNRVFLSGATDEQRAVFCYDADSGELLWRRDVPTGAAKAPEVFEQTGYAAPTMATDGHRVFALFATGDLVAFDFDGNRVWGKFLGLPDSQYGFASSLLMWRDRVILQFDQGPTLDDARSALIAFDAGTGKELWRTDRPVRNSWSSPAIIPTPAGQQIITSADPWVIAYDPQTGQELWRAKVMHGDVAPSPAFGNGLVFVCQEGVDLVAIRPDGRGDVTATHKAWEVPERMPDINSPVASDQFVLVTLSDGMVACYSATDGQLLWEHELEEMCGKASPILVGQRIYQLDEEGVMHIFEAYPQFKRVGGGSIGQGAEAAPAIVDGRIYIRGQTHLFCIAEAQ